MAKAVQPLAIKGAYLYGHQQRDLYTSDVVLDSPAGSALAVDLEGCTIFPGLINAHDHLELNHYPRSKFRDCYDNAHQWGEEMNARLDSEPYRSLRAYPLWDRLFIGGLKNLLCGATSVAHHNPPHRALWRGDFPVRVLRNYGWAHSLHFETDAEIVRSYRVTPRHCGWFIHLAEGTDEAAAGEYRRLKALGCVGRNTVIVHGVGMTDEDFCDAARNALGIVWCPSTNVYLLGRTLEMRSRRASAGRTLVGIGSDSRLTADGDLLHEIQAAMKTKQVQRSDLLEMLFAGPARMFGDKRLGHLERGAYAEWLALPHGQDLFGSCRADLTLVVFGGVPRIGAPDIMAKFPHIPTVDATLDGVPKRIHADLARRIHQCRLQESGLHVDALPDGRRFWIGMIT